MDNSCSSKNLAVNQYKIHISLTLISVFSLYFHQPLSAQNLLYDNADSLKYFYQNSDSTRSRALFEYPVHPFEKADTAGTAKNETVYLKQEALADFQNKTMKDLSFTSLFKPTHPPDRFRSVKISYTPGFMHSLTNITLPMNYSYYDERTSQYKHLPLKLHYKKLKSAEGRGYRIQFNFVQFNKLVIGSDFHHSMTIYRYIRAAENAEFRVANFSTHLYLKYGKKNKKRYKPFLVFGAGYLLSRRDDISVQTDLDKLLIDAAAIQGRFKPGAKMKSVLWSPRIFASMNNEFVFDKKSRLIFSSDLLIYYNLRHSNYLNNIYVKFGIGIGFLL